MRPPETETLAHPIYLGDGVYVGHDHWHVVLWLLDTGAFGENAIALEPSVMRALSRYVTFHTQCIGL